MADTKANAWTDAEKLDLIFQIVDLSGPIPWDKLKLPAGRTKKACSVMIDREKQKVRKAREATGDVADTEAVEAKPKGMKRKANDEADGAKKKAKGRNAVKAGEEDASTAAKEEPNIKAEEGDDMEV